MLNKVGEFAGYDRNKIAQLYYDQNKSNFAVYSVINYCAEAIADTLRYAKIVNKKQDEVTDHWSYNLLLDNPNEFSNTSEFGKAYAVNRLLFGDAYVYLLRGIGLSEGRIKEMIVDNGIGFTGADAFSGTMTAKYFLKHNKLESWQVDKWLKQDKKGYPRLCKYHKQINEEANKKAVVPKQPPLI